MPLVNSLGEAEVGLYYKTNLTRDNIPTAYTFNLSSFRDPMGQPALRALDGGDEKVQDYLREDSRLPSIIAAVRELVYDVIGLQGANYMSLSFTDHHGKWISKGVAHIVGKELSDAGYKVFIISNLH